jgi:hypothetical protein
MHVSCPSCMVATHVQSVLRAHGVTVIQLIGPHLDHPRVTVMIQQHLSVETEPTIRREIQQVVGTTIVGYFLHRSATGFG